MTLLKALLHPLRHVRWNKAPDLIYIFSGKGILPQSRLHNIIIKPKERLRGLLHARIFTREPSHKERIVAARIELRMDSPLRENSHLIRVEFISDTTSAILQSKLRNEASLNHDINLRAAGMRMRGIETTGANEAKCHADAGADEGWEDFTIGTHGVATFTACDGVLGRVVEVVDEVGVVGDETDAFFGGGGERE